MTIVSLLILITVVGVPAVLARRFILAGCRAVARQPARQAQPSTAVAVPAADPRDPAVVRRIPADIAGQYPLSLEDKDISRALLRDAATPNAHRYAIAMTLRAHCPRRR